MIKGKWKAYDGTYKDEKHNSHNEKIVTSKKIAIETNKNKREKGRTTKN